MQRNIMFSVVFDRKKDCHFINENGKAQIKGKDKLGLIQIRVYDNKTQKNKYFTTNISVKFNEWNFEKLQVVSCKNASVLNRKITALLSELQSIEQKLSFQNRFSLDNLANEYKGSGKDTSKFLDFAAKVLNGKKNEIENSTYRSIKCSINNFKIFKDNLYLSEINITTIKDYHYYLKSNFAQNTVVKRLSHLKDILKEAENQCLIEKTPFVRFKIGTYEKKQNPLTDMELQRIEKTVFSMEQKHLEVIKDMFLFACYTGLSFIDVIQLSKNQILETSDCNVLEVKRQKTKELSVIPLNIFYGKPQRIIDKYLQPEKENIFPKLVNQYVNRQLKVIAQIANFQRFNLSFRTSRATCATCLLNLGLSMDSVAKVIGHSTTKYTKDYAKLANKTLVYEISKIFTTQ